MKQGILWFDDSNLDFYEKINQAVEYIQNKYHKAPRCCFVHPNMLSSQVKSEHGKIKVQADSSVLPNHFWLEMIL